MIIIIIIISTTTTTTSIIISSSLAIFLASFNWLCFKAMLSGTRIFFFWLFKPI